MSRLRALILLSAPLHPLYVSHYVSVTGVYTVVSRAMKCVCDCNVPTATEDAVLVMDNWFPHKVIVDKTLLAYLDPFEMDMPEVSDLRNYIGLTIVSSLATSVRYKPHVAPRRRFSFGGDDEPCLTDDNVSDKSVDEVPVVSQMLVQRSPTMSSKSGYNRLNTTVNGLVNSNSLSDQLTTRCTGCQQPMGGCHSVASRQFLNHLGVRDGSHHCGYYKGKLSPEDDRDVVYTTAHNTIIGEHGSMQTTATNWVVQPGVFEGSRCTTSYEYDLPGGYY